VAKLAKEIEQLIPNWVIISSVISSAFLLEFLCA
jgi:hypothetical protein